MEKRLKGKVIVLAGAGGIGDELARRYAREGAAVVVGDLDGAAALRIADEITGSGGQAAGLAMDCSKDAPIAEAVALATARFGGLDGFHANFTWVSTGDAGDILQLPMDDFDAAMRVDARGYVLCSRHALPALLKRGGGVMLYTSSASAYMGEPTRLAYAMSKASIHALMRHVAVRFGPQGIRANIVAPGLMWHAKLAQYITPEMAEGFKQDNLLKTRLGTPDDIAAVAALLMADEGDGQSSNTQYGWYDFWLERHDGGWRINRMKHDFQWVDGNGGLFDLSEPELVGVMAKIFTDENAAAALAFLSNG